MIDVQEQPKRLTWAARASHFLENLTIRSLLNNSIFVCWVHPVAGFKRINDETEAVDSTVQHRMRCIA